MKSKVNYANIIKEYKSLCNKIYATVSIALEYCRPLINKVSSILEKEDDKYLSKCELILALRKSKVFTPLISGGFWNPKNNPFFDLIEGSSLVISSLLKIFLPLVIL